MNQQTTNIYPTYCLRENILQIYTEFEKNELKLFFKDTYHEELKMFDIKNHLRKFAKKKKIDQDPRYIQLIKELEKFSRVFSSAINGEIGEKKVLNNLKWIDSPNEILSNVELRCDNEINEYDAIVITNQKIFIIETKFSKENVQIDKKGFYRPKSSKNFDSYNIAEKLKSKEHVLMSILNNQYKTITPNDIQSIVVFTNKNVDIQNNFGRIQICNPAELVYYINDNNLPTSDFSIGKIQLIKEQILNNNLKNEYPLNVNLNKIHNELLYVLNLINQNEDTKKVQSINILNKNTTNKDVWSFDWKSFGIGTAITSFTGIAGTIIYKQLKA